MMPRFMPKLFLWAIGSSLIFLYACTCTPAYLFKHRRHDRRGWSLQSNVVGKYEAVVCVTNTCAISNQAWLGWRDAHISPATWFFTKARRRHVRGWKGTEGVTSRQLCSQLNNYNFTLCISPPQLPTHNNFYAWALPLWIFESLIYMGQFFQPFRPTLQRAPENRPTR